MRVRVVVLVASFLLLVSVVGRAQTPTPLSEKHKKWLEEEVVYIIADWEKDLFLSLPSAVDRDKYIKEFWRIRDPNPATPENEFKIEHYRRIEYANRYFGFEGVKEGWRTDRGRIYIQLGPPAQRQQYRQLGEIRPLELWFYNQSHPSLPNAFNVMFFRPDEGSDYVLYSPYGDGPDKLVTKIGHENDPLGSFRFLQDFNPEVARASMTLLTDEPVDPRNFSPSLASDALISRIFNLPNDKFTREMLDRRRHLSELVETRIHYEPSEPKLLSAPFWDEWGQEYLHFLLRLPDSLEQQVKRDQEEKYLSLSVNVLVRDSQENTIFQQEHKNYYSFKEDYASKKELPVAYEDLLPLPPGEYKIDFVVRNEFTQALYQTRKNVELPAYPQQGLQLSPLIPYDQVFQAKDRKSPLAFRLSKYKFAPRMEEKFGTTEKLRVLFQIVAPQAGPKAAPGETLQIEYTLGNPAGGYRETAQEEIPKREFTDRGIVLHGKTFPLSEFPTGSYRLVVTARDPATGQQASRTLSFRVVPGAVQSKQVRLVNLHFQEDFESGLIDYRRALCQLAHQDTGSAEQHLKAALGRNPGLHRARNRLVALYFEKKRFQEVASLFPAQELTGDTDLETLRRFITSFEKTGQMGKAIETAQTALKLWGPRPALYEELARLFDLTGQPGRAQEIRTRVAPQPNK